VRRLEERMNIPRLKIMTNITISSKELKYADVSQFEYYGKFRYRHICGTIKFYQDYVAPVEAMAVFNDGREEPGLAARKGMPDLIPRKIHQIWVRGEIPNFKQFLMKRLRDAHPDYEYFLWTEDNITRENFP
jgi:mannosyltransferase OCH1-like enzyme